MLQRILLLLVWCMVVGCNSGEYNRAYEYAKEELGKSERYARAYAEQVDAGKGKIYARNYAKTYDLSAILEHYDEETHRTLARIFAEKRHQNYDEKRAIIYAKAYCKLFFKLRDKYNEVYFHEFAENYLKGYDMITKTYPQLNQETVETFSARYGIEMISGATPAEATKVAIEHMVRNER